MREFWAFVMICAAVFAAFATSMLVVVIVQAGRDRDVAGWTALMVVAGWIVAYWAWRFLRAIPRKKEDIW